MRNQIRSHARWISKNYPGAIDNSLSQVYCVDPCRGGGSYPITEPLNNRVTADSTVTPVKGRWTCIEAGASALQNPSLPFFFLLRLTRVPQENGSESPPRAGSILFLSTCCAVGVLRQKLEPTHGLNSPWRSELLAPPARPPKKMCFVSWRGSGPPCDLEAVCSGSASQAESADRCEQRAFKSNSARTRVGKISLYHYSDSIDDDFKCPHAGKLPYQSSA